MTSVIVTGHRNTRGRCTSNTQDSTGLNLDYSTRQRVEYPGSVASGQAIGSFESQFKPGFVLTWVFAQGEHKKKKERSAFKTLRMLTLYGNFTKIITFQVVG
ncbi:UNVERIFIED_CONTAM: hypothetical protein FKN15_026297 [Acipenser sinensis]